LKVLGIIGDILGIVVNTVCNIVDTAIHLLSIVLHGAVDVISKLANGIISVVTLNQTNLKIA
jgi:phage-related protein